MGVRQYKINDELRFVCHTGHQDKGALLQEMSGAYAYFPIEWGPECDGYRSDVSPGVLTIYVVLPCRENDDEQNIWAFSLEGVLETMIDDNINHKTGNYGVDCAPDLMRLRNGLRRLCRRIDGVLAKTEEDGE